MKYRTPLIVLLLVLSIGTQQSVLHGQSRNEGHTPVGAPKKIVVISYPPLARQAGLSGDVSATVNLYADGRVQSVSNVVGHPFLVASVVDALRQWEFALLKSGKASVRMTFRFVLRGEPTKDCAFSTVTILSPAVVEIAVPPRSVSEFD